MFFCTIFRFAGGNLDFVAGEKNVCFCGSSLAPHLSVRGQPWKKPWEQSWAQREEGALLGWALLAMQPDAAGRFPM